MNPQKIHIFRAGTHTTMGGQAMHFSEMDMQRTAMAYKPSIHLAPLVLGHPASDSPAYGTVSALQAQGKDLYAMAEVSEALKGLVRAKSYIRVSAAFYGKDDPRNPYPGTYYLRHVGFLGGMPPAVKGLEPPAFAGGAGGFLAFADGVPLEPQQPQAMPTAGGPIPDYDQDPEGFNAAVLAVMKATPAMTYQQALGQVLVAQARQQRDQGMATHAAPERMQLHMRVRQVQQQDPSLSYAEALSAVHIF